MKKRIWVKYKKSETQISVFENWSFSYIRSLLVTGNLFQLPDLPQSDFSLLLVRNKSKALLNVHQTPKLISFAYDSDELELSAETQYLPVNTTPSKSFLLLAGSLRAIKWEFTCTSFELDGTWEKSAILLRIDNTPFAGGSMREAYRMKDLSMPDQDFVAKKNKRPLFNERDVCFFDVKLQKLAKKFADEYNKSNPPKRVDFLDTFVVELVDTPGVYGVEKYVKGKFIRYNNNTGYVSSEQRNTPQAFSHFTYEASHQSLIIVDIQGVDDRYTDPQIHTSDSKLTAKLFSSGNFGKKGIEAFICTHLCNPICQFLKLPSVNSLQQCTEGTVPVSQDLLASRWEEASEERTRLPQGPSSFQRSPKSDGETDESAILYSPVVYKGTTKAPEFLLTKEKTIRSEVRRKGKSKRIGGSKRMSLAVIPIPRNQTRITLPGIINDSPEEIQIVNIAQFKEVLVQKLRFSIATENLFEENYNINKNETSVCPETEIPDGDSDASPCLTTLNPLNDLPFYAEKEPGIIENFNINCTHSELCVNGVINSIVLLNNAQQKNFVTGSSDGLIKFWDSNYKCINTLRCGDVSSMSYDGYKSLFSGSTISGITIWDVETNESDILQNDSVTHSLDANSYLLAAGMGNKTVAVWDFRYHQLIFSLSEHTRPVKTVLLRDYFVFSGSTDKKIKIWDLRSPENALTTLSGHSNSITSLCYKKDVLFSGSLDSTVMLWNTKTFRQLGSLCGHNGFIDAITCTDSCVVSGDDKSIVMVWPYSSLRLLPLASLKPASSLDLKHGGVRALAFQNNRIIAGSTRSFKIFEITET